MNPTKILLASVVILATSACESTDSEDVKTSGMYATFTAISDGSGTRAEAVLKVGGATSNTFVKLSSGDTLSVKAASESLTLTETHFGELYSYVGDLTADAPGTEFTFVFDRTSDEDAPSSKATMPAAFNITAPAASTVIKRSESNTITWDSSGSSNAMTVEVKGGCIIDYRQAVTGDPGTFTLNAGALKTPQNKETESCSGTIVVTRASAGTLDPAFGEGGSVTASQQRTVEVRIDP